MRYLLVENKLSNPMQAVKFWLLITSIFLLSFTIGVGQPTVGAPTVTSVGTTTATLGGNVTGTLTHRGTRWSAVSPVTAADNQQEAASATAGVFTQARTGLPAASQIFFVAFARNGAPEGISAETSFFTEPTQLVGGEFTAVAAASNEITLTFPAASIWKGTGSTAGYVIYRNSVSPPSLGALADGAAPPLDGVGDKIATITNEALTTFNDNTGLSASTDYYYTIIPFVWNGATAATYNYRIATPQTANDFTFSIEPGSHATGTITTTAISSSQIDLSFNSIATSVIADATGYIILIKSSAIVVGDLATLVDGAAPNSFSLFEAIINSTSAAAYSDMSGLIANTTYHYAIIPYNRGASDETYNYLTTTGFATGSAATLSGAATFTPINGGTAPVILSAVLSAGSTLQVLAGFSVTSDGTQIIDDIGFNYSGLAGQFTKEYLYRSTTASTIGTELLNNNTPDGDFPMASVSAGNKTINSTPVYYYLVVDVANSVTSATASVNVNPTQANINVASGTVNAFSFSRPYSFSTSQNSTIVLNGGTSNDINYVANRNGDPLTSGNSVSLATFRILDGGGVDDDDNKSTRLTQLVINIPVNHTMVRRVAIFDGGSIVAGTQQDVTGSSITFSGLTINTANDGASETKDFTIRATFQNIVTDNARIDITITGATASNTGSGFASFGATTTGVAAPANQIEVNASALSLSGNPSSTTIATNFPLTLRAIDSQDNTDLDYGGSVALTKSGGAGTLSVQPGQSLTPTFTNGVYNWTTLRLSQSGSYTLTASDNGGNDEFSDPAINISVSSSSSGITQGTTTPGTICYGNTVAGSTPTAYFPLSNIVITETDPAGISGSNGSYTFSVGLPSGFVFDQSVIAGVSTSGGSDITIPATPHYSYPSANTVQFSFNLAGTGNSNTINIAGLKVGYTHPGTATPATTGALSISRAGGNANIAGVNPGTVLGTVGASQQNAAVSFTVDKALVTDPPVEPTTTTFNSNGSAVKLVPVPVTRAVFTGTNTSFVNPDYRFNPNGLSAGIYPITLRQTADNGCQSFSTKNFEVIVSGIVNLNPSYCTNAGSLGLMEVFDPYVDQVMGENGYTYDHFVYYDWNVGGGTWVPLIGDINNPEFDPSLTQYQASYQIFKSYGYPGLAVGFAVCDGPPLISCNQASNRIATYQWVDLKAAPSVSFSLPGNIYTFCKDNVPVVLTGLPANSNNPTDDKFTASSGQGASISNSVVPPVTGSQVWVFSSAAVTGVLPGAPQTFSITYQYKDPATGCSNTASRSITVKDRPTSMTSADITIPINLTEIKLCQSTSVGSFTAATGSRYRWYSDVGLTTQVGTGNTFNPPVDNTTAAVTPFWVTRTTGATPIPFFAGCESDKGSIVSPLALSVNVVAKPVAPTPNFSDAIRQYCVGITFDATTTDTHLVVPGTNVKWYDPLQLTTPVFSGASPTSANLGLSTAAAKVYKFSVTQTENINNCEGDATPVNVTIKALPIVAITTSADVNKICTTKGNITFSAFDLADSGNKALNGTWSAVGIAGSALNQFPTSGTVNFDPSSVSPNNYSLQYQFQNDALCSSTGTLPIRILPIAVPSISIGNVCDLAAAVIINNSTVSPALSGTTIDFVEWTFGDGRVLPPGASATSIDPAIHTGLTNGTYFSPTHIYPGTGTFQLTGTLITSDGCPYLIPNTSVKVSPVPKINFSWKDACKDGTSSTQFLASETTTPAPIPISSYAWNFTVNNTLSYTAAGSGANPTVNYNVDGTDDVELLVTTVAGCTDVIKKPVYIVPTYPAITVNNGYTQSFDGGADGWIAGGANSSWQLGTPDKTVIKGAASGANAWVTNLTSNNNQDESSWVLSQCFDFSQATKPVFSIDIWSNTPKSVDGAVLQYNETGNIEKDADWKVVGTIDQGVNWYDDSGISNSPGNQSSGDFGWSGEAGTTGGKYATWQRAIFKLDDYVIGKPKVIFRVAFASKQASKDGFAFDNIFIGERSRIVLLENFTNSSSNVSVHNNKFRSLGNSTEIVKVQYHTPFPGEDAINNLNKLMHNARTAFYGITRSPTMRLDGFLNGNLTLDKLYDNRSLSPTDLEVTISTNKVASGDVEIVTTIRNTSNQALPLAGAHIFTTIVQKSITDPALLGGSSNTEFIFVGKQMLPTPTGIEIPKNLAVGETYSAPKVIWELNNGDAIVVSVQSIEGNNKEVHQAGISFNPPQPDLVTGIETIAEYIQLYPNPANDSFVIELPTKTQTRLQVNLIDQVGRPVQEVYFEVGEQSKTVDTHQLAGGIYVVQIGAGKFGVVRKKIMIVHQN